MQLGLSEDEIKSIITELYEQIGDELRAEMQDEIKRLGDELPDGQISYTEGTIYLAKLELEFVVIFTSYIKRAFIQIVLENNRRLAEQLGVQLGLDEWTQKPG